MCPVRLGSRPRVSVVLPVRDGAAYLKPAVESVLGQTFEDFELIAIDDGSRDDTPRILRGFRECDRRVRILRHRCAGQPAAMNLGIRFALGEYIARMDADDLSLPERFARQVDFLDRHLEAVAVGTQVELIDQVDRSLGFLSYPQRAADTRALLLGHSSSICHPAAMIRRADLVSVGGFRRFFAPAEDYDLWLRLSDRGEIHNLGEVLFRYRFHPRSLSYSRAREQVISTLISRHLYASANPEAPAESAPPSGLTRELALALGVLASQVDRTEAGMAEWYVDLATRAGDVDSAMAMARAVAAEASTHRAAEIALVRCARSLCARGAIAAASELLLGGSGAHSEAAASPRLRRAAEALELEASAPLRAGLAQRPGTHRTGVPGALDRCEAFAGGSRFLLAGWTAMPASQAGFELLIQGLSEARIERVCRCLRPDVAAALGEEFLLSGFEVELALLDGGFEAADEVEVSARSADGSSWSVPPVRGGESSVGSAAGRSQRRSGVRGHDLVRLDRRPVPKLSAMDVACYMAVRDEAGLLPLALAHQRALGVRHFFIVDHESSDGTAEYLLSEPDVTVFRVRGSFRDANFGFKWLEALLNEHGVDRWCLVLDADEALVYPHCEGIGLGELARYLSRTPAEAVWALCIDTYGERSIAETDPTSATASHVRGRFFDRSGYQLDERWDGSLLAYGGARARLFWPGHERGPERLEAAARASWNEEAYLAEYADVAEAIRSGQGLASGYDHYVLHGRDENRRIFVDPSGAWPEADYLEANPDVVRAVAEGRFASGLDHYMRHGRDEGRMGPRPPCLSLLPLVRWSSDSRFGVARHSYLRPKQVEYSELQVAILHQKLDARLLVKAQEEVSRAQHWQNGSEYRRYLNGLSAKGDLTAFCGLSERFVGSQQLLGLGLMRSSIAFESFVERVVGADMKAEAPAARTG